MVQARARAPASEARRGCAPNAAARSRALPACIRRRACAAWRSARRTARRRRPRRRRGSRARRARRPALAICASGACTIRPTSRLLGPRCEPADARAATSPPPLSPRPWTSSTSRAPNSNASPVASATSRSRQSGIGRTRRGAPSTTSTACGPGSHRGLDGPRRPSRPASRALDAKLAWTCSRSSSVSLARRSRSSSAIARVFRRAWPTGRP